MELFGVDEASFKAAQVEQLGSFTPEQLRLWKKLNAQVHQDVEVGCELAGVGRMPRSHMGGR